MSPEESVDRSAMPGIGDKVCGEPARILIANYSPAGRREIARAIQDLGPVVFQVANTSEAIDCIDHEAIDLLIADAHLDTLGGVELCRRVKADSTSERVPVVLLSRRGDNDRELRALEAGADAFFMGPLRPRAFRARVRACLRQKAMMDSLDESENVLLTLAQSVEGRDPALGQHCERLALIAVTMGVHLDLPGSDILALQRGGYLHDVGKVAIPDSVLLKPGPLNSDEWVIMKTHPERGEKICSSLRSLTPVLPIIRHHHEKWDGSGYPDGLRGEEIPLLARILQFADIYDALTADRPYKRALTSAQALETMRAEAQKGWRDPDLMSVFERVVPTLESQDGSAASLQALAQAIERSRKLPAISTRPYRHDFAPVKLVSGF